MSTAPAGTALPTPASPSAGRHDRPRLCFVSYPRIRAFAAPVIAEYTGRADIEVVDGIFEEAIDLARARVRAGAVDAFVSAGSNASLLKAHVAAPVTAIQITGFDILQSLLKARHIADRVGVVTYAQPIPELDEVRTLLNIDVAQYAYRTPDDARERVERLHRDGFRVIVGSSLIVDLAEQAGMHGLLAYSRASVRQGFEDALERAKIARAEAGRYQQLGAVIRNLHDAMLAVNRDHRIIAINPAMQQVMGQRHPAAFGHSLDDFDAELSLRTTLTDGIEERGVVLRYAQRDWIANRTPIREHGTVVGAAITLYDAHAIQEADASLRIQQRRRQGVARYRFDLLHGSSPAFLRTVQRARRYARTDLNVLIAGESGVGKELFAQAIHQDGKRSSRPFVAVNCASLPESLLESELFGYEDGAFTGSRRGGRRGLFEAAHTGTLFLDEIGDMPIATQTRLLRVLQEREIMRLGSTVSIPIDVRIIAATHQPLESLVAQQRFRQDLYYRINALRLTIPPLRERPEDILPLLRHLVQRQLHRMGCPLPAADALGPLEAALLAHDWPGNVRELENVAERVAVFLIQYERLEAVDYDDFFEDCPELRPRRATGALPFAADTANPIQGSRRERAERALRLAGGSKAQAAQILGIGRATLWRWLQRDD